MDLVLSLILIIVIIVIYSLLIQIFTVLFRITGLTKQKSRFQVISLLTNSGYTTSESELITNNRTRRKISRYAMVIGTIFNVVIVSLLINIMANLNWDNNIDELEILGWASLALVILIIFMRLPFVRHKSERLIEKIATKINDKKKHENIITELDVYGNKMIVEIYVSEVPDILKEQSLENTSLMSRYNIYILLIERNGKVLDVKKDTIIQKGDKLVVFGKSSNINDLFNIKTKEEADSVITTKTNTLSIIDNYDLNAMVEIEINNLPKALENVYLAKSGLREKYDINVLMIKHNEKPLLVDGATKINLGDTVILLGPYENIKKLFLE